MIAARGYRTILHAEELRALGFAASQCRAPGLLLPLYPPGCGSGGHTGPPQPPGSPRPPVSTLQSGPAQYVYRPDNPRVIEERRSRRNPDGTRPNKVVKYEYPWGKEMRLDCPPACQPQLGDPRHPLWITEGQKKADALASQGLTAIALLGVWNFLGRNAQGGKVWLPDWDYVALNSRRVRIVYDSDVMRKFAVSRALQRLTRHLQGKGAQVAAVYLPHGPEGRKWGVDDWLAAGHTAGELERLVEAPRPAPQPAPPTVELLEAAPPVLRRPLALVLGRAYAAAWLHVRLTRRETINGKGEIVRHDPPLVTNEQRLFVVRDDGVVFGEGGDRPLAELGLEVALAEPPPPERLWSAEGVKAYRGGARPDPAGVFERVRDVVNRFVDFDRSLAGQSAMAEMIACYCLATWLLDAFNVIGFLWPSGDRGSGKTHLLFTVAELSYLGQVILAGGSYASLRDLADYGATLAFDDAENLSDPKKTDPDKRALLLAGNRRGATVPLKELGLDKHWRTRHVNAFCPRLFSATRQPDPILGSRTITVPLIRTADRHRANAEPTDPAEWPHDRRRLLDDLWALGLAGLPALPEYDKQVARRARLTGRSLQPWRALLAVALWLDVRGVPGLWERMERLSVDYQSERQALESGDLTALVIRALCRCIGDPAASRRPTMSDDADVSDIRLPAARPPRWTIATAAIAEAAGAVAQEDELDIDRDSITPRRVGRALGKMRFATAREPGTGARQWVVTGRDLARWCVSYGLPLPDSLTDPEPADGETGPAATDVTDVADVTPGMAPSGDLYAGEL